MWSCCIEPDASQAFPIITLAIYANAIVSAAVNADAAIANLALPSVWLRHTSSHCRAVTVCFFTASRTSPAQPTPPLGPGWDSAGAMSCCEAPRRPTWWLAIGCALIAWRGPHSGPVCRRAA